MKYYADDCLGEECDGDEEDRPACDDCLEGDNVCLENCWDEEPVEIEKLPFQQNDRPMFQGYQIPKKPDYLKITGKLGGKKILMGGVKKITLWKPKSRKSSQIMGKMQTSTMEFGMKGHMNHHDHMRSMDGFMMGSQPGMRLMKHGVMPTMQGRMFPHPKMSAGPKKFGMKHMMKFGPMMTSGVDKIYMTPSKVMGMHPFKPSSKSMMITMKMMGKQQFMNEPMHGGKMANHFMETGPLMHSRKSIRGEFYTNVIFVRDGTCNTIVHDLTCFGEKRIIRMKAGRVSQTPISVPMCPRPTVFKNTTAIFTCDNGASFVKPISLPVKCAYAPCKPGFWLPDWSNDQYWQGDNSYTGGDHWGNKPWWMLARRQENDNWFLAARDENRVFKNSQKGKH